ncbi:methylamine dehydrogenase light chain [Streptomyces sp. NPDC047043]|uniref:methylamine dehydrogenase light chain n=1 Tax=Streptomyces sp. NPDC047043 TaxID=3154497 RepID=UPI0033CF9CDF
MTHDTEGPDNRVPVDQQTVDEQARWLAGKGGGLTGRMSRRISERVSRRSALSSLGRWAVGVTGVTVVSSLPVSRAAADARTSEPGQAGNVPVDPVPTGKDPSSCDYWRLCNMDGMTCADCAGGGVTTCPPGARPGAEYWVGCCSDPDTRKTYLMAYYDCCGASACSSNFCGTSQVPLQTYNPVPGGFDQQIVWCVSDESQTYTCTIAPVIGEDCTVKPVKASR